MSATWRIPYGQLLDHAEAKKIEQVIALLKIASAKAIDSYSMSADGPILTSVFLISTEFLVEVKMDTQHLNFDVTCASKLFNYRVKFAESEHRIDPVTTNVVTPDISSPAGAVVDDQPVELKPIEVSPVSLITFVEVNLRHTDTLSSRMCYFGNDKENWLSYVLESYPPSLLSA